MDNEKKKKCFQCSLCHYTSFYRSNLRRHFIKHSNPQQEITVEEGNGPYHHEIKEGNVNIVVSVDENFLMPQANPDKSTPIVLYEESPGEMDMEIAQQNAIIAGTEEDTLLEDNCIVKIGIDDLSDQNLDVPNNKVGNLPNKVSKKTKVKVEYFCSTCPYKTPHKSNFTRHLLIHRGEKPFKCEICQYKSTFKHNLIQHIQNHHGPNGSPKKRCYCPLCDFTSRYPSSLYAHLKQHLIEKQFECNTCKLNFTNEDTATNHMREHPERIFSCPFCWRTLPFYEFIQHLNTHYTDTSFICDICGYKSFSKSSLERHSLKHPSLNLKSRFEKKKKKMFICKTCKTRCPSAEFLAKHIENKHPKEKAYYKCKLCDYKTEVEDNFLLHKCDSKKQRKGIGKYICESCGYFSNHKANFTRHLERHNKEDIYFCTSCPFKSTSNLVFARHVIKHSGEKKFCCMECDFRSYFECELRAHVKRRHSAERRFSCLKCERGFFFRSDLMNHMKRKHLKIRPYPCDFCDHRAATKTELSRHLRKHTGEKPFICHVCGYCTALKTNLDRHIERLHLVEVGLNNEPNRDGGKERELFLCDVCSFISDDQERFSRHLKLHKRQVRRKKKKDKVDVSSNDLITESNFLCEFCGYVTFNKGNFHRHVSKHSSGKIGRRKNNVSMNKKNRKNEESTTAKNVSKATKVFLCDVCPFSSVRKQVLINHMRLHPNHSLENLTGLPGQPGVIHQSFQETVVNEENKLLDESEIKSEVSQTLPTVSETNETSAPLIPKKEITNTEKHVDNALELNEDSCLSDRTLGLIVEIPQTVVDDDDDDDEQMEKPIKCGICDISFFNKRGLSSHMRRHMTQGKAGQNHVLQKTSELGTPIFLCKVCNFQSRFKSALNVHVRKHTGELFTCSLCDYKTPTTNDLLKHSRTHKGDKPFICDVCGYRSSFKSNLQRHYKNHLIAAKKLEETGTTANTFSCEKCGFTTSSRSGLTKHILNQCGAFIVSDTPVDCNLDSQNYIIVEIVPNNEDNHVEI